MIKIDIEMPVKCNNCFMCQIAFDSELFKDGERYCCLSSESVENNADSVRADFCKLNDVEG